MRVLDPAELRPSTSLATAIGIVEDAEIATDAERHRAHVLEFCRDHPDALHRSCELGHLTGSAAVVEEGTGRFAMLLHAKVGLWLQPGGHADGDANLAAVSLAEASEETGIDDLAVLAPAIDLDVHLFRAVGELEHLHLDVRHLVLARQGATFVRNHESRGLRWTTAEELPGLGVDPGVIRLTRRATDVARDLGVI